VASWLQWTAGPRGVFRCAKSLDDEGILVLSDGLGDSRLPNGRDLRHTHRVRPLNRDLADAGSARVGRVVASEPPSAEATAAAAPSFLMPPLWREVLRPVYTPRGAGGYSRARRAYPLSGISGTLPLSRGHAGPPLAPLPMFTWERSAQLGTPLPVLAAIWSGLGRSLGEFPSYDRVTPYG